MIRTSYFGKLKKLKEGNFVSIAAFTPKWFKGEREEILAPHRDAVTAYKAGRLTQEEFIEAYKRYLDSLGKDKLKEIVNYFDKSDAILLCYEKPEDFCHRHVLSKYLNEMFGLSIIEI